MRSIFTEIYFLMKTLFINIKELLQIREANIDKVSGAEMAILPKIDNAFITEFLTNLPCIGIQG